MADQYIGEIIAVGFYYGTGFDNTWAPCDGRVLPIQQYSALFSLIGTAYGGDGTRTFALPNLNGRVAASQGQGPGLTTRSLGEQVGTDQVTLTHDQMPKHNHQIRLGQAGGPNTTPGPGGAGTTAAINPTFNGFVNGPGNVPFAPTAIAFDGGQQPHPNDQPTTGLWYLIALSGIFPNFN
ncbi:phage tail protein [Dongia sedimenti]|uniref:Tail fiber protein n=1 Tax=Dongia sedimenti TaxID=3064282 RepID=A0ABU0YUI6_9PROT|nr:tail fiber protein [Rhodospirillaceae bacterium R-7]